MYRVSTEPPLWTAARPRGGAWLMDELRLWQTRGVRHVVCLLTRPELVELDLEAEASGCAALGVGFTHLPVPDRTPPPSARAFFNALGPARAALADGAGVLTHCRQGIGRASLAAGALMVERGHASADVWTTIAAARGRSVPDTREQADWLASYAAVAQLLTLA